jgi:hypothetical protein
VIANESVRPRAGCPFRHQRQQRGQLLQRQPGSEPEQDQRRQGVGPAVREGHVGVDRGRPGRCPPGVFAVLARSVGSCPTCRPHCRTRLVRWHCRSSTPATNWMSSCRPSRKQGRGEVISNPRIVTSNQKESVIRQGKEIGYLTITGSGLGATPTVAFKEALLELKVTPTITNDGRVFLNLGCEEGRAGRLRQHGYLRRSAANREA